MRERRGWSILCISDGGAGGVGVRVGMRAVLVYEVCLCLEGEMRIDGGGG